jgi:sterol desaturase/sphingolipid hydroxylase (fatty acid hydroxylase superfamily)
MYSLTTCGVLWIGQLVFGPIALVFLFKGIKKYGLLSMDAPLPPALDILTTYVVAHVFNGVGFYWAHRLFHSKLLYSTFHKQHHEYTGMFVCGCVYLKSYSSQVCE